MHGRQREVAAGVLRIGVARNAALPAAERATWRERIARTARERYGWPIAAAAYRELVASLRRSDS